MLRKRIDKGNSRNTFLIMARFIYICVYIYIYIYVYICIYKFLCHLQKCQYIYISKIRHLF